MTDVPESKRKDTGQQFGHEQARKGQADIVQDVIGDLPRFAVEALVTAVLADVQGDEEVGKDAADVGGDEGDDGVVAPFAGEEALEVLAQVPDPRVFAVDLDDVAGDEVAGLPERGDVLAVGAQERRLLVEGGGLSLGVVHG